MHRESLLKLLEEYQPRFMDELAFVRRSIDYISKHEDCFLRELWPAHVTGSAWVVSPDRNRVLMLHHKKIDQWFQPGGHADGDSDIVRVAMKEASEESGIALENIRLVDEQIFDLDIHVIAARGNDPEHQHIDIRFLLEIDDSLPVPGNDESHQVIWVELTQVSRYNRNRSIYRMLEKTRWLRNQVARQSA